MKTQLRSYVLLGVLVLALPFLGLRCKRNVELRPVTLQYWRVFDDQDAFKDIIAAYQQQHPNVRIEYRKLRYEEFEQELLEALAEDRGPDIISIHNTWIGEYASKIAPLPPTVTLPYQYTTGTVRKEVVTELRTTPTITPAAVRQQFIDAVGQDVIRPSTDPAVKGEQILGLPLAVDTLALFYNKDIINNAGIATIPEDWSGFLSAVAKTTKLGEDDAVTLAGAALGTARNIPRFSDIVSVLMMQNGAVMTDANNFATFHLVPKAFADRSYAPGLQALRFYTDFANPTKEAYTWNDTMPDALEAFIQGRVGFFFGYSYHIPTIQARAPQLRYAVAPLPQTDPVNNRTNVANYWVETVMKKSEHQEEAWDFIVFASKSANVKSYLQSTGKPTALRSLIAEQLQDPVVAPFTGQLLTAKSWYRGNDATAMEAAMADLVTGAVTGTLPLERLVANAVQRINETIR